MTTDRDSDRPSALPWPYSVFVPERADAQHFMGSHWQPFVEDARQIIDRLPEIASNGLPAPGLASAPTPGRSLPATWPTGFQLVWPSAAHGLALTLRADADANHVADLFPFFATGARQTFRLREVIVWKGRMAAQIRAEWNGAEVTFFDTRFVLDRSRYDADREYDFSLCGIAYAAGPAATRVVRLPAAHVAALNPHLQAGELRHAVDGVMHFDGAAIFLPIESWDIDDHEFRAPVKSVTPFEGWLGQDGWQLRATVMRVGDDDRDLDLDILVTRRAWSGDAPPQVGQDIRGRLWLQGSLAPPP